MRIGPHAMPNTMRANDCSTTTAGSLSSHIVRTRHARVPSLQDCRLLPLLVKNPPARNLQHETSYDLTPLHARTLPLIFACDNGAFPSSAKAVFLLRTADKRLYLDCHVVLSYCSYHVLPTLDKIVRLVLGGGPRGARAIFGQSMAFPLPWLKPDMA